MGPDPAVPTAGWTGQHVPGRDPWVGGHVQWADTHVAGHVYRQLTMDQSCDNTRYSYLHGVTQCRQIIFTMVYWYYNVGSQQ